MNEVLGDAEPPTDGDNLDDTDDTDDTDDGYEYDDGFDRGPGVFRQAVTAVFTPSALAIAALAIATMTLFAPLPNYVATALAISHNRDPLFGERAVAVAQLVAGAIAALLAILAIWGTGSLEEDKRRLPQALAGAALLIMALSVVQAAVGLVVLAHTHFAVNDGFVSSSG
jgi:hypothetical protein